MRLITSNRALHRPTRILEKVLVYFLDMKRVLNSASDIVPCILRPNEYANVFKNSVVPRKLHNPYYFLFFGLINALAINQHRLGLSERVDFIFDEQVMEKSTIVDSWDAFKLLADAPKGLLGDTPSFRNDQTTLPLQAADMCVWIARRRFLKRIPPLPWIRNKEVPGLEFVWTEQEMRDRLVDILELQDNGEWPSEE
jgi:hypothetical protein